MGWLPGFADPSRWRKRFSKAIPQIDRKVWYNPDDDYGVQEDPNPLRDTWHQIDWRERRYRDVDPETGKPVAGSEGRWRPLR